MIIHFSRDFGFENMQRFKGDLGATDWSNVLNESDVEKAYDKFLEVLISLYEKNFPLLNKKQKGRRKISPDALGIKIVIKMY